MIRVGRKTHSTRAGKPAWRSVRAALQPSIPHDGTPYALPPSRPDEPKEVRMRYPRPKARCALAVTAILAALGLTACNGDNSEEPVDFVAQTTPPPAAQVVAATPPGRPGRGREGRPRQCSPPSAPPSMSRASLRLDPPPRSALSPKRVSRASGGPPAPSSTSRCKRSSSLARFSNESVCSSVSLRSSLSSPKRRRLSARPRAESPRHHLSRLLPNSILQPINTGSRLAARAPFGVYG